ncbi:MAG: hypothetical protein VX498_01060 [Myxococcota bacterium]|nr:hypothetical protein [Myxococcota bacterium]
MVGCELRRFHRVLLGARGWYHCCITRLSPNLRAALLVGLGFFAVHLLLLLGTFDVYDLEETEYGNVAVGILDGQLDSYVGLTTDPSQGEALTSGAGRRRRAVWSVEPLVAPVFLLLGTSMLSLKLFGLAGGALWAGLWFLIARRLLPRLPVWLVGLLFVLPLPLVQRAALSVTSITAHLGSSLWHGAALLLALLAWERKEGWAGPGLLLLSGAVAGWGVHCSFSVVPLLLGVAFVAYRTARWRGLCAWGLGTVPGLLIAYLFRDPSRANADNTLIVGLTGLSSGSGSRLGADAWDNLVTAAVYGAGFGRVDPESFVLTYLPQGAAYALLLVLLLGLGVFLGRRGGRAATGEARLVLLSLALSTAAFMASLALLGFTLEKGEFDGLRYLLPVSGVPLLCGLWAACRIGWPRSVVGLLVVVHLLGFGMFFRAETFPAPWHRLKGFEPWVMKAWLQGELEPSGIAPERIGRWALWAGNTEARRLGLSLQDSKGWTAARDRHGLENEGAAAFWRGFGFGLARRQQAGEEARRQHDPEGGDAVTSEPLALEPAWSWQGASLSLSTQERAWLWQGMGMSQCHPPVPDRQELLARAPTENRGDLWYGFARADFYCGWLAETGADAESDFKEEIAAGRRDAWLLDYGAAGQPVDPTLRARFTIY